MCQEQQRMCRASPISAVILAGGRGERLGRDKASLCLGQKTLLQRVMDALMPLSDDLIVVLRRDQGLGVSVGRIVRDLEPYEGVLAAMAAGLMVARYPWSVLVACDMPFINPALIRQMLSLRSGYDIVVPRLDAGLEPLHALYHQRCLSPLQEALLQGRRRVVSFYASLRVRYMDPPEITPIDPHQLSFFNINSEEDLSQAQMWINALQRPLGELLDDGPCSMPGDT